jgi:outer membrane lipoprotein carrier protein
MVNKKRTSSGMMLCLIMASQSAVTLAQTQGSMVNNTTASQVSAPVATDSKAQLAKILLRQKLAAVSDFSSVFEQTVSDQDGKVLQQSKGSLAVSKPNKVRWHTAQPDDSLIVSDGQALWFYDPFIEQVSVYGLTSAVANTPMLLLSSNDEQHWQNYHVIQHSAQSFDIVALDADSQVKTLTVYFSGQNIEKFSIVDATGQLSQINLSNVKRLDLADQNNVTMFEFTVPDGVELDDQR